MHSQHLQFTKNFSSMRNNLKRWFRFYRHLVAVSKPDYKHKHAQTHLLSNAACHSHCILSDFAYIHFRMYFKIQSIFKYVVHSSVASKNYICLFYPYLFVFQSNLLFFCLCQLWQENRPDYFNMKLYVSQADTLQVCVSYLLLLLYYYSPTVYLICYMVISMLSFSFLLNYIIK